MLSSIPKRRLALIEKIIADARRSAKALPPTFLQNYYRGVGEEDLAARPPSYFAGLAAKHAEHANRRAKTATVLHIEHVSDRRTVIFVVTTDRPFLVDSIGIALAECKAKVQLLVHPVLTVRRDARGRLLDLNSTSETNRVSESWQMYEIERLWDPQEVEQLRERLQAALTDVGHAVDDWLAMRSKVRDSIEALTKLTARALPTRERDEAVALLDWMEGAHFVFLGYRYHRLERGASKDHLVADRKSGLGILRAAATLGGDEVLQGELREAMRGNKPLIITKSPCRSTVHRSGHLDHLAVKDFDARGRVRGEHRFLGLWTATAYFASPNEIPVVRRKVAEVIERFGLDPRSHDGKAVLAVLETWPRDELFQSSPAELVEFVRGVVNLYDRQTTRLMLRHDALGRFWSCMVFVPRDRYTTEARLRIEQILLQYLSGESLESQVQIALSNHARLHVTIRGGTSSQSHLELQALETTIAESVATWTDQLADALQRELPAADAARLQARHARRFPANYQSEVSSEQALLDITALEELDANPQQSQLRLHRPTDAAPNRVHLRLCRHDEPVPIADLLPLLENFGLRMLGEKSWQIAALENQAAVVLQDFALELQGASSFDIAATGPRFIEALRAVRRGLLDNDGFNRLVLLTTLDAYEVNVLRACCRYLLQTGIPFSQSYMERCLYSHADLAAELYAFFATRHQPQLSDAKRAAAEQRLKTRLNRKLEAIVSADEDRILRSFVAVIEAILRCNFFQRDAAGARRPALTFKLDPQAIPGLPLPRPRYEMYVFGSRVEGVHLRMGEVARGGLRWSDRREDFRTEVLGLMKAQNVKNTLIVPVGAKGGFVPRRLPSAPREAVQAEGVAAYRLYINALLDVTDNIVAGKIAAPPALHRRDPADPYLVVAADKGTATFSDTANAIAIERGFWLGDAFASGGSAGYDHKKMGITARGAWECVKRHFREIGHDTQTQPFTVAGIGDMSGDVFGNGMLLSQQIKLVAAFNHQHIFIDPAPDPAKSFAERSRLFALPRSGWNDYDVKLISKGGGIYERSAKTILLSPEARALLGITNATATPLEVVRAILCMQVDLLWNGGIGTYVKASSESQLAAGDRSNDAVRVDGRDLRAKVVGEGGNLGFTQRGRVEYALQGGRINTDFIDNSAGVNTSDVEVNLKILTTAIESSGRLKRRDRDRLLVKLTNDVAQLVLRNNYLQSQALSTLQLQANSRLLELQSLIRSLERSGELDRAVEFLPDDETLLARRKQGLGLTRPELAVVLAYSKISLNRQLLASDLPEDRYFAQELQRYFPSIVASRYIKDIRRHRLQREIITTAVTNSLVNRMGPSFVMRAMQETGASAADVARAYSIAREVLAARELWSGLEKLDNRVATTAQYSAYADSARLLRHATMWLLRRGSHRVVADTIGVFDAPVKTFMDSLNSTLSGTTLAQYRRAREHYLAAGMTEQLAAKLAAGVTLDAAFDVAELAIAERCKVQAAATQWFATGARLRLDWIGERIDRLQVDGSLQAVARAGLRESLGRLQRTIVAHMLDEGWDAWALRHADALRRWERTIAEVAASENADFASLSVCVDGLRTLAD